MKTRIVMLSILYLLTAATAKATGTGSASPASKHARSTIKNVTGVTPKVSPLLNDDWSVVSSVDSIEVHNAGFEDTASIFLYNLEGKLIDSSFGKRNDFILHCPDEGFYIVRVDDENGNEIFMKKIWADGN